MLALIFLLVSCAPFITATAAPTRQPVIASLPPALRPWGSRIQDCAARDPGMDFFLVEAATASDATSTADLSFHLGTLPNLGEAYASQIGYEDIVIIAPVSNELTDLTTTQLRALFSGRATRWEEFSRSPGGQTGEVQLWSYPKGDEVRQALEAAILPDNLSFAQPMVAPDPQAMLEAVGTNKEAVGYVPRSWIETASTAQTALIKIFRLEPMLAQLLHVPVLAASPTEPQGAARALLVCLSGK